MMRNAVVIAAAECATADGAEIPTAMNPLSTSDARAGSPIQPRASDASVIPSWVPEM
jgi:hypothetical protein